MSDYHLFLLDRFKNGQKFEVTNYSLNDSIFVTSGLINATNDWNSEIKVFKDGKVIFRKIYSGHVIETTAFKQFGDSLILIIVSQTMGMSAFRSYLTVYEI